MGNTTRPTGISILAVLHIVGGVLGFMVTMFLVVQFGRNQEAQQALTALGLPPALLIAAIVFIFGLAIASGIGMWKGRKWGWYLGSLYYMYSVVRNANALITIPMLINSIPPEELAGARHGPSYYYVKHGGRVLVHFLLYLYFFKSNVREFFSLAEQKKWKPVLAGLSLCIAIAVATNFVTRIMNR